MENGILEMGFGVERAVRSEEIAAIFEVERERRGREREMWRLDGCDRGFYP